MSLILPNTANLFLQTGNWGSDEKTVQKIKPRLIPSGDQGGSFNDGRALSPVARCALPWASAAFPVKTAANPSLSWDAVRASNTHGTFRCSSLRLEKGIKLLDLRFTRSDHSPWTRDTQRQTSAALGWQAAPGKATFMLRALWRSVTVATGDVAWLAKLCFQSPRWPRQPLLRPTRPTYSRPHSTQWLPCGRSVSSPFQKKKKKSNCTVLENRDLNGDLCLKNKFTVCEITIMTLKIKPYSQN